MSDFAGLSFAGLSSIGKNIHNAIRGLLEHHDFWHLLDVRSRDQLLIIRTTNALARCVLEVDATPCFPLKLEIREVDLVQVWIV